MEYLIITENNEIIFLFQKFFSNKNIKVFDNFTAFLNNITNNSGIIFFDFNRVFEVDIFNYLNSIYKELTLKPEIFIILDKYNNEIIEKFTALGLDNFIFKPLNENLLRLKLNKIEKNNQLNLDLKSQEEELKKLRKNKIKLEKTLELMPDGVIIVDKNAAITFTNSQVEQLFGYKPEELIGKHIETLVPQKYRDKHIGYRETFIHDPKIRPMGSGLEVYGLKKDNSVFPVDISLSPVRLDDEMFIVSSVKDITERKNTQIELKKTKEFAEDANRAKSEFLANMSHELRTPLNAVLGYSQLLLRDKNLNEKQKDKIKIIKSSGEHLLGLISDILDLSKIESGTMELNPVEFNLHEFINSMYDIFKIRASERGLILTYEELTPIPVFVNSDEKKLRQILFNLLSNAIKFTEKGGIALKVGIKDQKILFKVKDTGIGIDINQQNELFKPFTQVSKQSYRTEGTGLGLSISQKLAKMMGSEIKIISIENEGSIFYFEIDLPVVEELNTLPKLDEKTIIGYKSSEVDSDLINGINTVRKKILIVDDKWENRSILLILLEPLGFEIMEANDGYECLDICKKYNPDLIFLDLRMPGIDGFETTKRVRELESSKDIIIITVSASAFQLDKEESINAGCNDFIAKPFREDKIFQVLKKYLNLEWIYEKQQEDLIIENNNPNQHICNLPEKESMEIKELALLGDIDEIINMTKKIDSMGEQYQSITKQIQLFAKNFEPDKILNLINQGNNNVK